MQTTNNPSVPKKVCVCVHCGRRFECNAAQERSYCTSHCRRAASREMPEKR